MKTKRVYGNVSRPLAINIYDIDTSWDKFHNMGSKANYYWACSNNVNNNHENMIKGYNYNSQYINKVKGLYPYYSNLASSFASNIMSSVNCYIMISYLTNTITKVNIFSSPKDMNKKIRHQGNKVIKHKVYHAFIIPEQNKQFITRQLLRFVTINPKDLTLNWQKLSIITITLKED